ncbi:hypothetical protein NC652_030390 [Populus alba x Populus x berolinensis]|nr:hypothetical protein NC652_030390 [Populus alba x Populus x berolinensis]
MDLKRKSIPGGNGMNSGVAACHATFCAAGKRGFRSRRSSIVELGRGGQGSYAKHHGANGEVEYWIQIVIFQIHRNQLQGCWSKCFRFSRSHLVLYGALLGEVCSCKDGGNLILIKRSRKKIKFGKDKILRKPSIPFIFGNQ